MLCHQPNILYTMTIPVMAVPSFPKPSQRPSLHSARRNRQMMHIFGSFACRHCLMGRELFFFCCVPAVTACLAMLSYSVLPYAMHVLCYAMLCRAVPCAALLCSPWDSC